MQRQYLQDACSMVLKFLSDPGYADLQEESGLDVTLAAQGEPLEFEAIHPLNVEDLRCQQQTYQALLDFTQCHHSNHASDYDSIQRIIV